MRSTRKLLAVTLGAFLVFALLTALSLRMTYDGIAAELEDLRAEADALDEEIAKYENDLACEMDDALIERIARERLGLCYPGEIIYHVNQ